MSTATLFLLCLTVGFHLLGQSGEAMALDSEVSGPSGRGWRIPFEGSDSSPVVAGDKLLIGSADGSLSAFDVTTGKRLWRFKTGKGLPSGVQIFVTAARSFGELAAEAESRAEKRKRSGKREIAVDPIVDGGTVYIGSGDHFYYALDAATGKPKWAVDTGGEVTQEALLYEDLLLIPSSTGFIEAVEASSGKPRWSFETLAGIARKRAPNPPVLEDGRLHVTSWPHGGSVLQSFLQAVDADTGELRWQVSVAGGWVTNPVIRHGRAYFASGEERSNEAPGQVKLYAVDSETGTMIWDYTAAGGSFPFEVVLADGVVLLQAHEGGRPPTYSLRALDQVNGEIRWQLSGQHRDLLAGDLLYVSGGKIEALEPRTGAARWSREDGRRIRAIVDGDLLVYRPGGVGLLDAATGVERWWMETETGLSAAPRRAGAMLFFATSKETYFGAPSQKGYLFAVEAEAGPAGYESPSSAQAPEPAAVPPGAPIDDKRLTRAIREATARVTPSDGARVTLDRQTREVYVSLVLPPDYSFNPADPMAPWRVNQRRVYKRFKKAKILMHRVTVEITLPNGIEAIRVSHSARDVESGFLEWLQLATTEYREGGNSEWRSEPG